MANQSPQNRPNGNNNNDNRNGDRRRFSILTILIIAVAVTLLFNSLLSNVFSAGEKQVTYDAFLSAVETDAISQVEIQSDRIQFLRRDEMALPKSQRTVYYTGLLPNVDLTSLISTLEDNQVEFSGEIVENSTFTFLFSWVLFPLLMLALLSLLMRFIISRSGGGAGGFGAIGSIGKSKAKVYMEKETGVTFRDVAGQDEAKESLVEIIDFLHNPQKYAAIGAKLPKGALLVGSPGTGKTLLAKAVAGEARVPFFSISGSDFVEMFVGVGASRVRDLFEQAKKSAPSIVFIDEIDAVGRHRGSGLGGGHDEREQTLNQLLVEMDGFAPNLGVIVMAATNRKDILDPALLRPGRFDRHITVNYPDVKGREAILRVHTRNKPIGPDVDLAVIARFTGGFTGADLENLTNEAALLAARKNRKAITMEDIQEATLKVAVGPEKRSHVITDKERRLTAYHESGHAIVTYYCPQQDKVHQVSIVPRGWAGGFTLALPEKDVSYQTKKWMEEEIAVLLAGRVAEQLVLEDVSTGASNDIERATKIARAMVCRYGFSEKLGPMIYGSDQEEVFLGRDLGHARDYSEEVAGQIDEEARRFIDEGYNKAVSLLEEHMDQLHALAEFLMKYEKIDGDLFAEVMSGVISFGEAAERTEQELASAREKAERARLQKEAQQKAAEEKKAQQGFSVDPLDFHLPHEEPPAPPMEEPKEDEDKQDPSGPADL